MSKLKKRKDGRYLLQIYLGTVEGRRKYKSVYGNTQKEVQQKADDIRILMQKGIELNSDRCHFQDWAELWLLSKLPEIGAAQEKSYRQTIDKLNAAFGSAEIQRIKAIDVQMLINQYATLNPTTGKPSSKKLLSLIAGTADQIFRFAIKNRIMDFNPAADIRIPKSAPKSERRALTQEEREWIIQTPHRMQCFAMIMLFAGLRKGEVIPLTWTDIDLKEGTISVNKAVEFIGGKPHLKSTKTKSGLRTVFIPDVLVDFLAQQKRENILVCPSLNGSMFTLNSYDSAWESYLSELDIHHGNCFGRTSKFDPRYRGITIPRITAHMLRHTFCTMMYEAGVDVMTAKEQMGHRSVNTTLNIYTHISESHTAEEMRKLNQMNVKNASQMQVKKI